MSEHVTGKGKILFMAATRPFENTKTGTKEYSIRLELDDSDPIIDLLRDKSPAKIDTKRNLDLAGTGKKVVNFMTNYKPVVLDNNGEKVDNIFFNSKTDTGTAIAVFKIIDYKGTVITRLTGIKLLDLNLAPREEVSSMDVTLEKLKNIH